MNLTVVTASEWAKRVLMQCPKSISQNLISLSVLPVASKASSEEISKELMGSLWP